MTVLGITLLFSGQAWAIDGYQTTELLVDAYGMDSSAVLSTSHVAWVAWPEERQEDLYIRSLLTGAVTRVTNSPEDDRYPDLSGDKLTWSSRGAVDQIRLYEAGTGVTSVLGTGLSSRTDGDYVVWSDFSPGDVYLYDIAAQSTRRLTSDGSVGGFNPQVSEGKVVWQSSADGDGEIYVYDTGTETIVRLTDNAYEDMVPSNDGEHVSWLRGTGEGYEVWLYSFASSSASRIASSPTWMGYPHLSDGWVAWHPGSGNVTIYDTRTGLAETLEGTVTADYDGDFILTANGLAAWTGNADMFVYDLLEERLVRMTADGFPPNDYPVDVDTSGVLWQRRGLDPDGVYRRHLFLTSRAPAMPVVAGWNLLAGGLGSDFLGTTLFSFDGSSYRSTTAEAMEPGRGYWARFQAPAGVGPTSVPAPLTVRLSAGWNLIGNATPAPARLYSGKTAFVFDGTRYLSKTTLEPGEGAWVRASVEEYMTLAP